jgi:LysR family glycine cleavage system transcriptional activator
MSPPAVSQQIRALEAHLGTALFDRAAAGVSLTRAGRSLLSVVGDALGQMESAAAAIATPGRPPLVIGVSLTLSAGWLAPRLPDFIKKHPEMSIELHSLLGRFETPPHTAALWIAFGQPPPGTEATRLFGERLIPVAHPDITARIDRLDDILMHPLIEVGDHRRNWAQVFGGHVLPSGAQVLQVDTTLSALSIASARGGVALARPPASDALIDTFGVIPCLAEFEMHGIEDYHLLHPSGVQLSEDALTFKNWLLAEAEKTRATTRL